MNKFEYIKTYLKDFSAAHMERKHIILLDGTWNDETGSNADGLVTNIVNLHRIFINHHHQQIVRYHRGVGNDNENSRFGQIIQGFTGRSLGDIIDRAYARLVQDWHKGDRIYIFGFSRGAAAARMLASKINKEGIPKSITITLIPKENKETKVVEQVIANVKTDFSASEKVDIEFLGVWDTVSALGVGNVLKRFIGAKKKDLFTNYDIASNIQRAVHLVAIDETRNPFMPSLMNHKEGITHEVWFPGVHSDIGGSYKYDSLAKASLFYMLKKLKEWNKQRGLKDFLINTDAEALYTHERIDKAYFHFHGKATGKNLRHIGVQQNGKINKDLKPKIHRLYYDIASVGNAYAVIKVRTEEDKKEDKFINFQYMPFNVKVLDRHNETGFIVEE